MKVLYTLVMNLLLMGQVWGQKPDQPVVFIPGFMGSNLVDENDELICCNVLNVISRLADLEVAEPPHENRLRPQGIIDEYTVLGPFKLGQYDELLNMFSELGFEEGTDLFIFSYDWRLSNFYTAAKLDEFIESHPQLKDHPFRVVGHSMGGIIARIFLHEYGEKYSVSSVITLGTPYLGTLIALQSFVEGFGNALNYFYGGDEIPKRVATSFMSLYELLPTYKNCCIWGNPGSDEKEPIDILDIDNWERLGWLEDLPLSRKQYAQNSLAQTIRVREIMQTPPPKETQIFKIVGSNFSTSGRVYFDEQGKPLEWVETNGDGVVTESSASNGDWKGTFSAIESHSKLFIDEHVKILMKRLLTKDTSLDEFSLFLKNIQDADQTDKLDYASLTRARHIKSQSSTSTGFRTAGFVRAGAENRQEPLASLKIETEDTYLEPNGVSWVRIQLKKPGPNALLPLRNAEPIREVHVEGRIVSGDDSSQPIEFAEVQPGVYEAQFQVPSVPGLYRIAMRIPDLGDVGESFVVLPQEKKSP